MDIQLISHASVILGTKDCTIWTDPWLHGKAFNDSWALYPPAKFDAEWFNRIDYIWISHEHPDHFHIPTLRALPDDFKFKTPILFQKNNSKKLFDALRKLGFRDFIELPQRQTKVLKGGTSIYCYQVGNMDSVLGVISADGTVLNVNDAELNKKDCGIIRKDIGSIDVVLNQFSIAGYSGQEDRDLFLPKLANNVLNNVVENHRDLDAKVTIPFASLIYFCREDNCYINEYANTVEDLAKRLEEERLGYVILFPGESWSTNSMHNNKYSIALYREAYKMLDQAAAIEPSEPVSLEKIETAYNDRFDQISANYWRIFRGFLKPVSIKIPDISCNIIFSMRDRRFQVLPMEDSCDLIINSQPLWFLFAVPFGCQTLGVSARYTLKRNVKNWKIYRILFSLNNAEIYLSGAFFSRNNISWIAQRATGLLNQLRYQIKRM